MSVSPPALPEVLGDEHEPTQTQADGQAGNGHERCCTAHKTGQTQIYRPHITESNSARQICEVTQHKMWEMYTAPVIGSTLCQRAATAVPPHSWAVTFSSLTPRPTALCQFSLCLPGYLKLRKLGPWMSNTSTPVSGKDCAPHTGPCAHHAITNQSHVGYISQKQGLHQPLLLR